MFAAIKFSHLTFIGIVAALLLSKLGPYPGLGFLMIGLLLGAALNYFQFGFRSCAQQLLLSKRTQGVRAIIIMLSASTLLFFPLVGISESYRTWTGLIQPLSVSVAAGAFIFGIGMQMGNGCTSGTLNKVGQLQPLSITVFISLIVGGTLAAYHFEFWRSVPALEAISLVDEFGVIMALILQLGLLVMLYRWAIRRERNAYGHVEPLFVEVRNPQKWHPWLKAGLFLAFLNALLMVMSGHPWSIANVFPLWGLKLGTGLGFPLDWEFWDYGMTYAERIEAPVWMDTVTLTTVGVILGAFVISLQSSLQKKPHAFQPIKRTVSLNVRLPIKRHFIAIIGGILMGYGSVIAFGCNIGAFFSGVASGSLHGWLWAVFALMGNAVGLFGLRAFEFKRVQQA